MLQHRIGSCHKQEPVWFHCPVSDNLQSILRRKVEEYIKKKESLRKEKKTGDLGTSGLPPSVNTDIGAAGEVIEKNQRPTDTAGWTNKCCAKSSSDKGSGASQNLQGLPRAFRPKVFIEAHLRLSSQSPELAPLTSQGLP